MMKVHENLMDVEGMGLVPSQPMTNHIEGVHEPE